MIKILISIFTVILIYFSAKITKDKGDMQLRAPDQNAPVTISPDIKVIIPPEVKSELEEQAAILNANNLVLLESSLEVIEENLSK